MESIFLVLLALALIGGFMSFASFLPPTREMVQLFNTPGRAVEAVKQWRAMDHKLADGTRIKPTVRTAIDYLRFLVDFPDAPSMLLVVEEGSYTERPWWNGLSPEEREEQYYLACESWHERYAEAGSSHVFGGGNPSDANLIASMAAGEKPRREDYGLPPIKYAPAPKVPETVTEQDADIPF
jgi:hypothetical protein